MDDFRKDLEQNQRSSGDRAPRFKLKNGDNKIVILTNPVGFSQVFGIGLVYEDCGYGKYGGRKYKCYVLDLEDNAIKIADLSYTTSKNLLALSEGARTKFEGFPMPYSVNLKTSNAGTKEITTDVLADEDYTAPEAILSELEALSPIQEVINNLQSWTKKQVEENPEMQAKVKAFLAKKLQEELDREEERKNQNVPVIDYPENDLDEIPF